MGGDARASAAGRVTEIVFRPAVIGDLDAILRIEVGVFGDPWSRESFAPEFDDPYSWFRVVEVRGELAGFVIARIVARQGEIANIAVDPKHQGTGLGGQLLDVAISAIVAEACEAIWLEVRETNEPAKRLYVSRGFEAIGRRKRYYKKPVEDALVLRRTLPEIGAPAQKQ